MIAAPAARPSRCPPPHDSRVVGRWLEALHGVRSRASEPLNDPDTGGDQGRGVIDPICRAAGPGRAGGGGPRARRAAGHLGAAQAAGERRAPAGAAPGLPARGRRRARTSVRRLRAAVRRDREPLPPRPLASPLRLRLRQRRRAADPRADRGAADAATSLRPSATAAPWWCRAAAGRGPARRPVRSAGRSPPAG